MGMYCLKTIFIVSMIFILSCDLFSPDEKTDSVKIYPRISFAKNTHYSLESVDSIKVLLRLGAEGQTKDTLDTTTFYFKDGQGDLTTLIPIKTPFEIIIYGLDTDGIVLYKGEYNYPDGIKDDITILIEPNMVTPLKPSNLRLKVFDDSIQFTWNDKSSNEDGFYLIKKEIDSPNQQIDTIKKLSKGDTIAKIKKENKNYKYFIEAFNEEGSSYNPDTIEWYLNDTLKIEKKLILPVKDDSKYEKNIPYHFQLGPVQTKPETCPLNHKVQFKFHFDDTETDWIDTRAYIHIWESSGKKKIKFKKRCSINRYAESDWSPEVTIEVK